MPPDPFRWQALFQQTHDPVFILNRRRRLLFANRAWETLTGQSAGDTHGLTCTRRSSDRPLAALARALCPPAGVLQGRSARVVRAVPGSATGPPWWEIEFLPLTDANGVIGILGKIAVSEPTVPGVAPTIIEAWAAIRAQAVDRFRRVAREAGAPPTLAAQARLAAASGCPVYLVGERGTGKRWLARAIHHASDRRALSFTSLDCADLPARALREMLFGPRGLDRPAWLGTLYLNEPAALPRELQAELTERLADEGELGPRVIAGTAEADDPKRPVFLGQMLSDLFDTLTVLTIPLAPLRARKDELPRLVQEMLKRAGLAVGKTLTGLTAEGWECLREYHWPGNLRELYATLLTAGRGAGGDQIDATDLPLAVQQARAAAAAPAAKALPQLPPLDTVLEEVERRMIRLALEQSGGNQSKAAELLAVWRPRLIRRIKALGLEESR
jgi:transcriptional regulator with PAS, ATPase and Fis domain